MEMYEERRGKSNSMSRSTYSEERESTPYNMNNRLKTNTLQLPIHGKDRKISVPAGHYAATVNSAGRSERGKSPGNVSANGGGSFRHYGSSLSLSNGSDTADLTTRTLRPPSPTTLRKSSVPGRPSFGPSAPPRHSRDKPSLPSLNTTELQSPKLADYLEKPRLVGAISTPRHDTSNNYVHHAKRMDAANSTSNYRNLRLGNFIENGESNDDELIPDRLRQYYLDTYLNVCDTCESKTHLDPTSPIQVGTIQRGM